MDWEEWRHCWTEFHRHTAAHVIDIMRHRYIRSLDIAAVQFKLSLQVGALPGAVDQRLTYMQYGRLGIEKQDLQLSPDDVALGQTALQHTATFALALAIDSAFERLVPDRFNCRNPDIAVAARIARILRNAFSHDPFFPRWICTNPNHRGMFAIPGVISLDTTVVNGQDVDWRHYGGPLALLRFLRHCQGLLITTDDHDSGGDEEATPPP